MFTKFLMAAVLAVPLAGALPTQEAKADAPRAVAQSVTQTVSNASRSDVRTVREVRREGHRHQRVHRHRHHHHRHGHRVHFHRR